MKSPLVTVNILSYNRKDELRLTLTKVFEQDYKNIEVIVVDNASSDGTQQMVKTEFPLVNLIELKENIGIVGWNKGFKIAKGEYVLVLDDDSYPEEECIALATETILNNPEVGIIACKIENNLMNIIETEDLPERPISFIGCGALIDMKKLKKVGYFDTNIFIYFNELDLSARFVNENYDIYYLKESKVIHRQSLLSRGKGNNPYISEYRYRNSFWSITYFLLTKFSFPNVIFTFTKWMVNRFIVAVKNVYIFSFFKSLMNILIKIPIIISNRIPLKKDVQKKYNNGNLFSWYKG